MEDNKKSNVLLLIFLFVIFVSLISVAIYFYLSDGKDKKDTVLNGDYNLYTYKTNSELKLIEDKYLIDYQAGKIMDLNLNTLYDGEEVFSFAIMGVDGNLYVVNNVDSFLDYENYDDIIVYQFNDNKLNKVMEYDYDEDAGKYPGFVIYQENDKDYLYGIYDRLHDIDNGINNHKIHLLDNSIVDLGERDLVSNTLAFGVESAIYIRNKDYLVLFHDEKYALYDVKNDKNTVDYGVYSEINYHNNNGYVVALNNKQGIIDYNGNKILDCIYDEVLDYALVNDGKIAALNSNNKIIGEFIEGVLDHHNYVPSLKVNNKYFLVDVDEDDVSLEHTIYVYNEDGSYKSYKVNDWYVDEHYGWIQHNDVLTVFDSNFNKLYDLNVSRVNNVFKYEKCLVVEYYVNDDEARIDTKFFDLKDGKEKNSISDVIKTYGKYNLKFDVSNSIVNIYENDNVVASFSLYSSISLLEEKDGNLFVINTEYNGEYITSKYVSILKKS